MTTGTKIDVVRNSTIILSVVSGKRVVPSYSRRPQTRYNAQLGGGFLEQFLIRGLNQQSKEKFMILVYPFDIKVDKADHRSLGEEQAGQVLVQRSFSSAR